jgi:hypothetical protein
VLLVKRTENFALVMQQASWRSWLAPILATLPKADDARTEQQKDIGKFVLNFYAMILFHAFTKGDDFDKVANRVMDQLTLQCGWTDDVVAVVRSLFACVLVKIASSSPRWKTQFELPEWQGLFKVGLA